MTSASQSGRELIITVAGVDDFVIRPLPGRRGKELTDLFLRMAAQQGMPEGITMEQVLAWSVNGVDENGKWITTGPNSERLETTTTLKEAEDVYNAAFYWSTVLGIDGVNVYLVNGGGLTGSVKALGALTLTLGISPSMTSPSSALENLISQVSTPSTGTPSGGGTLAKLPDAKRSRKPKQRPA